MTRPTRRIARSPASWTGVALALACAGAAAAESAAGLGAAFRPPPAAEPAVAAAAPAAAAARTPGSAGLRIVVTGKSRPAAWIDGQLVHVGDQVGGLRVTRIGPQGVTLSGENGVTQSLQFAPPEAKRKPAPIESQVNHGSRP